MRSSACCNRSCDLLSLWLCLQLTLVSRRHQWVDPLGWSGTCILCGPPTGRSTLTVASHSTGWIRDGRQGKTTHDVIAILIFLTETVVHAEWFGRLSYFLRGAGQTDQLLREIGNHLLVSLYQCCHKVSFWPSGYTCWLDWHCAAGGQCRWGNHQGHAG